jgi:hypothetical protein
MPRQQQRLLWCHAVDAVNDVAVLLLLDQRGSTHGVKKLLLGTATAAQTAIALLRTLASACVCAPQRLAMTI